MHRLETSQLQQKVEELERANLEVMSQLLDCKVQGVKVSRFEFLNHTLFLKAIFGELSFVALSNSHTHILCFFVLSGVQDLTVSVGHVLRCPFQLV